MSEWDVTLIVLGALTGAAGGSVIGVANRVGLRRARTGETRPRIDPSLVAVMVLGVIAAAVGLTALFTGHKIGLPLGVILAGVLVVMAARHVRRELRAVAPPQPPAISKQAVYESPEVKPR